jgi:hypothetical protein
MPPQSKYARRSGTAQQARTSVSSRRGFYQIAGGLWARRSGSCVKRNTNKALKYGIFKKDEWIRGKQKLLRHIGFFRRPPPEKTGGLHFATLAYKLPLTLVFSIYQPQALIYEMK